MTTAVIDNSFFKEFKVLASLAWPLLIAQVTQTLMGVSDTIMAGRYNSVDMAAVAIGFGMSLPVLIFMQGITLGLSPIISRYDGAKNTADVANAVQQMLYISLGMSVFVLLLLLAIPGAVGAIDMTPELAQKTGDYLFYVLLSAPAFGIYQTLRNYCEGLSITVPTMMIMATGLLVNIPVNYIFINGLFGMPEMGGAGCGLATMLVFYTMALATFAYTFYATKLKKYKLYERFLPISKPDIDYMLRLGLPIAFTLLFEVALFAVVAVMLAPLGALTVAAHQIALNVSSLIFMLPLSIGLALAIRIGFLIGEGRHNHTKKAYWAAMLLAVSMVVFTASTILLFNDQIASIYSGEKAVITAAASLLILAALFQFSDAIQVVSANALRGYKDTKAMLIISFISYWLVGFPVGVMLGLTDMLVPRMAAAGFWIGFITGLSVAAVLLFMRVKVIQKRIIDDSLVRT
ncbi:MATE family efflux transporter [Glaciecola punicea]|jgi:MATE family multidrug resistance protein|uniref:MATE family efflux transporter n=1 Tax=Glaciecola punicea TaxID=56804 RepID=UPI000871E870|nr:MATE family efflux transporter [Glaciecola punicea]OFA33403.1 MATE family efflux transporter [Glaciecola punicea]